MVKAKKRIRFRTLALFGAVLLSAAALIFFWRPLTVLSVLSIPARLSLWRAGIQGRYVTLPAHKVHYLVSGEGRPVVLVHGLGGEAANFASWIPQLARNYRVYAIDLLGFGSSDKPRSVNYSMALQA